MGVQYMVICRGCKRQHDLFKSHDATRVWTGTISGDDPLSESWILGKIVAFLRRHWGHEVDLISDCGDEYYYPCRSWEEDDLERPPVQT